MRYLNAVIAGDVEAIDLALNDGAEKDFDRNVS